MFSSVTYKVSGSLSVYSVDSMFLKLSPNHSFLPLKSSSSKNASNLQNYCKALIAVHWKLTHQNLPVD